jgi:hypothetical protein
MLTSKLKDKFIVLIKCGIDSDLVKALPACKSDNLRAIFEPSY